MDQETRSAIERNSLNVRSNRNSRSRSRVFLGSHFTIEMIVSGVLSDIFSIKGMSEVNARAFRREEKNRFFFWIFLKFGLCEIPNL